MNVEPDDLVDAVTAAYEAGIKDGKNLCAGILKRATAMDERLFGFRYTVVDPFLLGQALTEVER